MKNEQVVLFLRDKITLVYKQSAILFCKTGNASEKTLTACKIAIAYDLFKFEEEGKN